MNKKRVAIATGIGVLTGLYCAGSLLIPAFKPPGLTYTPEPWWLAMIFIARASQGFVIGIADGIHIRPVWRGVVLGAAMSLVLVPMPLFGPFKFGALLLLVMGIIYGLLEDVAATHFSERP